MLLLLLLLLLLLFLLLLQIVTRLQGWFPEILVHSSLESRWFLAPWESWWQKEKVCCQQHLGLDFPASFATQSDHHPWTMCGFKRKHAQSWLYPVWAFSIDKEGWHNPEICITWNPTDVKRLWVSLRVSSCRYRTIIYTTGIAPGTFKPGLGNDKSPTNCDKWKYVSWILDIWKWSKREVVKEEFLVVAIYY